MEVSPDEIVARVSQRIQGSGSNGIGMDDGVGGDKSLLLDVGLELKRGWGFWIAICEGVKVGVKEGIISKKEGEEWSRAEEGLRKWRLVK